MATPVQELASIKRAVDPAAAATATAVGGSRSYGVHTTMQQRILQHGSTIGPITVLVILVVYSLLSPLLPASFHEYVRHILPLSR